MGRCMKTTVEISDALLERARQTAAREKTTMRQIIEEGLRRALAERRQGGIATSAGSRAFRTETFPLSRTTDWILG